jgi:hypothetical protein
VQAIDFAWPQTGSEQEILVLDICGAQSGGQLQLTSLFSPAHVFLATGCKTLLPPGTTYFLLETASSGRAAPWQGVRLLYILHDCHD